MKRNPVIAFLLSMVIPGLGHIYAKKGTKGAVILAASIIIGSLNIIFLPVFISANPDLNSIWGYWIPRVGHDVIAIWSIVFWFWVCFDSYREAVKE